MKFYRLNVEEGRRKKYARPVRVSGDIYSVTSCTTCNKQIGGLFDIEKFVFVLSNDFLPDFTSYLPHIFVSEKMVDFLSKFNLGKCSLMPVNIVGKEQLSADILKELRRDGENVKLFSNQTPPYYTMTISDGARLYEEKMDLVIKTCIDCGNQVVRSSGRIDYDSNQPMYLDLNSWDGSDLFKVKHFKHVMFCSDRFYKLAVENNITGISFTEIEVVS